MKRSLGSFFKNASDVTTALAERGAIKVELKSYLQTMQVDGQTDPLDCGSCTQLIFQGWQDWPRNMSVSLSQVLLQKGHLALVATLLDATSLC